MRIGFYSKWNIVEGRFIGDHLYAGYLCKNLLKLKGVKSAELFAPNKLPEEKFDFMIYLNDTPLIGRWAKKHVLYFQNGYPRKEAIEKLKELNGFDLYLFVSEEARKISKEMGNKSELLTFAAETSVFYPREKNEKYCFNVTYVGNDIKCRERMEKFILPAVRFNLGLFGGWRYSKKEMLKYFYFFMPRYKKILRKISKGKISNENISILYGSSKINLNCTGGGFVEMDASTPRPFEILACKGFLITDDVPYLRKVLGGGAVYTSGGKDLLEKIKYYLEHDGEREKIIEEGYNRVIKDETVLQRSKLLLRYLKDLK